MNHENNIGTLRFLGAFLVLFGHSYPLSGVNSYDPISIVIVRYTPWHLPLQSLGVIMFFILSGYLVTQSFCTRRDLRHFFTARFFRIYPALFFAVLFCVFVIGISQTTYETAEFLFHPDTIRFLVGNITLWDVKFTLPGVFENNPVPQSVNGSLWTLPVEVRLYIFVAILGVLTLFGRTILLTVVVCISGAFFLYYANFMPKMMFAQDGHYLTVGFLLGMLCYIYREKIEIKGTTALIVLLLCLWLRDARLLKSYYTHLAILPFTYLLLYLAFMHLRLPRLDRYGDFSYGLYLYAYPVQQMCVIFLGEVHPLLVTVVSLLVTMILAFFSWHIIEKPALRFVPYGRVTT